MAAKKVWFAYKFSHGQTTRKLSSVPLKDLADVFIYDFKDSTAVRIPGFLRLSGWEKLLVGDLKEEIWKKSMAKFQGFQGIDVSEDLKLWLHEESKPEEPEQSKALDVEEELSKVFSVAMKKVFVTPGTAKKWNEAFVVRATPPALASSVGTVSEVFDNWRRLHSGFIQTFKDAGCKLPTLSNPSDVTKIVSKDGKGNISILLDRLGDETWTSSSTVWKYLEKNRSGVVPIVGVSGCGKTRFLYELLAKDWGFYFTASVHKNGGSGDLETFKDIGAGKDWVANFNNAKDHVRCAILSRLLILQYCCEELNDFQPVQWLLLQVEFHGFVRGDMDPFHALSTELLYLPPTDVVSHIRCVWKAWHLKHSPENKILMALDGAQVLIEGLAIYQTGKGSNRQIFSPFVRAPCSTETTGQWPCRLPGSRCRYRNGFVENRVNIIVDTRQG